MSGFLARPNASSLDVWSSVSVSSPLRSASSFYFGSKRGTVFSPEGDADLNCDVGALGVASGPELAASTPSTLIGDGQSRSGLNDRGSKRKGPWWDAHLSLHIVRRKHLHPCPYEPRLQKPSVGHTGIEEVNSIEKSYIVSGRERECSAPATKSPALVLRGVHNSTRRQERCRLGRRTHHRVGRIAPNEPEGGSAP